MAKIYRQAAMAVIINQESRVLIGYSPRDKSYKFPQGGLEDDEDLVEGIARELMEELGYRLRSDQILNIYEEKVSYPFPPNSHPIFMGQELSIVKIAHHPEAMTVPQDDEFDELLWIEPCEIVKYNSDYRAEAYYRAMEICKLL
jgi:putative (di)nucleoside polyphosphate hydrolase